MASLKTEMAATVVLTMSPAQWLPKLRTPAGSDGPRTVGEWKMAAAWNQEAADGSSRGTIRLEERSRGGIGQIVVFMGRTLNGGLKSDDDVTLSEDVMPRPNLKPQHQHTDSIMKIRSQAAYHCTSS